MIHTTHMKNSCHTYEWVMSHARMGHVTHMRESCHTRVCVMSHRTHTHTSPSPTLHKDWCEWVVSNIWMSHATHANKSCDTCKSRMSHVWMSHATHTNEWCHTNEWVTSHTWMRYVTHTNDSYLTYEWVLSHVWMSHITRINESCHTHTHTQVSYRLPPTRHMWAHPHAFVSCEKRPIFRAKRHLFRKETHFPREKTRLLAHTCALVTPVRICHKWKETILHTKRHLFWKQTYFSREETEISWEYMCFSKRVIWQDPWRLARMHLFHTNRPFLRKFSVRRDPSSVERALFCVERDIVSATRDPFSVRMYVFPAKIEWACPCAFFGLERDQLSMKTLWFHVKRVLV